MKLEERKGLREALPVQEPGPWWSKSRRAREILPIGPVQGDSAAVASVLIWVVGSPPTPEVPTECGEGKALVKDFAGWRL